MLNPQAKAAAVLKGLTEEVCPTCCLMDGTIWRIRADIQASEARISNER